MPSWKEVQPLDRMILGSDLGDKMAFRVQDFLLRLRVRTSISNVKEREYLVRGGRNLGGFDGWRGARSYS